MAIQWADNFDNYGTDETNMLDGIYAQISNESGTTAADISLQADPDPLESGKAIYLADEGATLRFVYPGGGLTTVGVAFRMWMDALPGGADVAPVISFRDTANVSQCQLWVNSDGSVTAYTGGGKTTLGGATPTGNGAQGTLIGSTSGPVLTANSWNHIEIKVNIHDSTGTIEMRVNGVTKLNLSNVDTKNTSNTTTTQVVIATSIDNGGFYSVMEWYLKDLIIWDTTGSQNNDFLGSCHVYTLTPDGDDTFPWTPSTALADGYTLIDESDPDDADYISSDYVTNLALQSETIDNATWTKTGVTVTTNVSNDGDGAATLDRITEDGASSDHDASQAYTFTAEHYIFQVDVRDNGAGFCRLEMEDGTSTVGAQFDLSDGSTTSVTATAAEAEDLGGGLWRLKIRHTMAAGAGSFSVYCLDTHGGSTTYTGDSSDGIEIGRALLATKSSFTTTYATTTASTVATINGDPSIFTLSNLPPDIVAVKGLISVVRATKTDGGDGDLQVGIDSNGSVDLGTDRAITASPTYWFDVSELSADTGVAYTPTEVDAAKLQLDRTT